MTIIYVDIVGDLFHVGHVNLLKRAASYGDKLIVGVLGDEHVEEYKRRPVMSLEERTSVIESVKYVDQVISPCPLIVTKEFMDEHDIDLIIHAHDESDTRYDLMYKIPMELGKFKRIDYTPGVSTTDIIERCVSRFKKSPV